MKNTNTVGVIRALKRTAIEQKVALWKRVAEDLERPSRQLRAVNLFSIEAHARDGETVVVPGKVLGEGDLTKNVTVVAFRFSDSALAKINKAGKALTIPEFIEQHPKAEKVRILG